MGRNRISAHANGTNTTDAEWAEAVEGMLGALEALHDVRVVLCVSRETQAHGGGLVVQAVAEHHPSEGSVSRLTPTTVVATANFPTNSARDFLALAYRLLHQLDHECARALWTQGTLGG